MALLFFHAGDAPDFFAGIALGFIGCAAILWLLWSRPPRYPIAPAILYFVIASLPGMLPLFFPDLNAIQRILVYAVIFPSIIFVGIIGTVLDSDLTTSYALIGVFLNAILFYVVGKTARWRMNRELGPSAVSPPPTHS